MNDFLSRVSSLPEDKRRLLNLLLRREPLARPDLPQPFVAPRTALEEQLADIWARALGLQQVGVHDHFIELGGDSIVAIQAIAMARESGLSLTSTQMYATPTIASLAEAIAREAAEATASQASPVENAPSDASPPETVTPAAEPA
jgi:aryl carrier-like protein